MSLLKIPDDWKAYFQQQAATAQHSALKNFYHHPPVDQQTAINKTPLVAMDFETTGLNPSKDDIVSVGLIPFDAHRIYCRDSQHWLIKPQKPLTEDSVVIHGIRHTDLATAPDLEAIIEEILSCLEGKTVVVHYRTIEREFFNQALINRIGEGVLFPLIDTMDLEAKIYSHYYEGFLKRTFSPRRRVSLRLAACRERYGLPAYTPHHALIDALATAELFQAQLAHHFSLKDPIQKFWR